MLTWKQCPEQVVKGKELGYKSVHVVGCSFYKKIILICFILSPHPTRQNYNLQTLGPLTPHWSQTFWQGPFPHPYWAGTGNGGSYSSFTTVPIHLPIPSSHALSWTTLLTAVTAHCIGMKLVVWPPAFLTSEDVNSIWGLQSSALMCYIF